MNRKKQLIGVMLFFLSLLLCACTQRSSDAAGNQYKVYYVNYDETGIFYQEYISETTDKEALVQEFLGELGKASEKLEYRAPLAGSFSLLEYNLSEDQLVLSFDENYRKQSVTTEVLNRAAIVRTLTQIPGISYVSFQIRSDPLTDASGTVVGVMNADMFIDNAGNEINTYEKVRLTLYFANETGDGLTAVNRSVYYSSNIAMERLVVEQLLAGPKEDEKAYPTINPDTKIVSVNIKDGICYVDFNSTFLTQIYNVNSEVTVYSLANSLAELSNVNKVQISVDGNTNVNYKENISLTTVFERNLELVK